MSLLISAVSAFAEVLILLLIARAVMSWFVRPGSSVYRLYQTLEMLTEPIVAPCRKITSRFQTGMFDFSIILAFVLVWAARAVIISILLMLA